MNFEDITAIGRMHKCVTYQILLSKSLTFKVYMSFIPFILFKNSLSHMKLTKV